MEGKQRIEHILNAASEAYDKDDGPYLLLLAVEVSRDGFPSHRALRLSGTPITGIASIHIARGMLDHTIQEIESKMDNGFDNPEESGLPPELQKLMKDHDISPENINKLMLLRELFNKQSKDKDVN